MVELFGQPGAGKSTVARAAAVGSEERTRGELGAAWKRQSLIAKGLLLGRTILDGPSVAQATILAKAARLSGFDSLSRLIRLVIKSHWMRRQAGPLLLEEGHLQDLWSILYSARQMEPEARLLAPLINCLYRGLDARIIFLDVGPDDLFDRIRNRSHGRSRLDRLSEAELRQHMTATARLPHRIVDAARLAGLRVETIDGSLPVETTVDLVKAAMRSESSSQPRLG